MYTKKKALNNYKKGRKFLHSKLYILSKNIPRSKRCPVPECKGQGNTLRRSKTHHSKNACPIYKEFMENRDCIIDTKNSENKKLLETVIMLSENIDCLDLKKLKNDFESKEKSYEENLLINSNKINELESENKRLSDSIKERNDFEIENNRIIHSLKEKTKELEFENKNLLSNFNDTLKVTDSLRSELNNYKKYKVF